MMVVWLRVLALVVESDGRLTKSGGRLTKSDGRLTKSDRQRVKFVLGAAFYRWFVKVFFEPFHEIGINY
jgi:hypothetical protein